MLGIVKEINGQKKIIPLTTDTGAGASVGSLIQQYKKKPMSGYLYCDGSTFDQNAYPALYMYLGSNVLPDYRECVMVGAEENTTDTIAAHDVYGEGEFKDDQMQEHTHEYSAPSLTTDVVGLIPGLRVCSSSTKTQTGVNSGRSETTTHGKQKAVYVYIKATSGLAENQQDNVLRDVKDYAFDKSKIRTGIVYGGSANNDNWVATFDTPFADSNYTVIVTPLSSSGAPNCPNGWYVVSLAATGFSIYCNGNAPGNGFQYIAIHN